MKKTFFKRKVYFTMILFLFFVMGIGYALIYTDLSVSNSITVKGYKSKKLYDLMMVNASLDNTSSTYVTSSSGINFSAAGSDTNGMGVYKVASTDGDTYPVFYYRGPVENNYVKFGGFCWKIVRTTNTGGVKIIYNGTYNSETGCANTETATQIGVSAFNTFTNPSLADVGYMYGTRHETTSTSMSGKKYTYANDVTYSNGTYTLVSTNTPTSSYLLSYTSLRKGYHYTCMSTATSCSTVYYIYSFGTSKTHHVTMTGGTLLSNVLSDTTTGSSNTTSSVIKGVVDDWYNSNLASYESYLEDAVWCNDRSIYEISGWDKDSDSTADLHFDGYNRNFLKYTPSVTCPANDSFTTSSSNGNGKLSHPVGLITADEIILGSGTTSGYLHTGSAYWTMTPSYYSDSTTGAHNYAFSAGVLESISKVSAEYGVRPMVSLKPGIEYSSGDGTALSPYIIG